MKMMLSAIPIRPNWAQFRVTRYELALGMLLCLGAYLGFVLRIDIVLGINFLFSSIFVWIAAFMLGPIWAIIVAFVGGLHSVEVWGHWSGVLMNTTEAVVVVLTLRTFSFNRLSIAVLVYWVVIGVPLALGIYVFFLDFSNQTALVLASKQALNAQLNAMLANSILTVGLYCTGKSRLRGTRRRRASYSSLLQATFGLVLIMPVLVFELRDIKVNFDQKVDTSIAMARTERAHLSEELTTRIKLSTAMWGSNLATLDSDAGKAELDALFQQLDINGPAYIAAVLPNGTVRNVHDPIQVDLAAQLRPHLIQNAANTAESLLYGCIGGHLLSQFSTGKDQLKWVFGWPLHLADTHDTLNRNPTMTCISDLSARQQDNFVHQTSATVLRTDASTTLFSWLAASIVVQSNIDSIWATDLTATYPMDIKLFEIQQHTTETFQRLYIVTAMLVLVGAILELLFRRWVQKFVFVSESYLLNRQFPADHLNERFTEDHAIRNWLDRFADAIETEQQGKSIAQNNFDKLVVAATIPIFAIDQEDFVSEWNPAMADLTGFTRDEIVGRPIANIIEHWNMILATNKNTRDPNFRLDMVGRNGRSVHILTSKLTLSSLHDFPPSDTETTPSIYYVGQSLRTFKEAQAKLIHASRLAALGEMASSFAHELNQPLNVISLSAGNMLARVQQNDISPEYLANKLGRIEQQAVRAGRIIQGIRQFVLKSNDEQVSSFDPIERTRSAVALFQDQLRLDSVKVEIVSCGTPYLVCGQPLLFEQVMVNLIANARRATLGCAPKDRRIEITCALQHDQLIITVQDWGHGIPDELRERIFEPFFSTKTEETGTGVGLYICRSVVDAMDGNISAVKSSIGGCIRIELPLTKEDDQTLDTEGEHH